jgi:hypothetical protein
MIMQLLKSGTPVFTARSAHTKNNSGHDLPITYDGDLSLYPNRWDEASVDLLEGNLIRIALQHGFELAGDYKEMLFFDEVVLTPRDYSNLH